MTLEDERDRLHAEIARLPDDQAAVVRLRLRGRTFAEIASELGIREEAARKRHLRASGVLRERLG